MSPRERETAFIVSFHDSGTTEVVTTRHVSKRWDIFIKRGGPLGMSGMDEELP